MARKMQVQLIDDIDQEDAAETVSFGLDGRLYEIDLCDQNAASLRASLEPYTTTARTAGAVKRRRRPLTPAATSPPVQAELDLSPTAVRAWAAANDISVSSRGRIPAALLERYTAAAGR